MAVIESKTEIKVDKSLIDSVKHKNLEDVLECIKLGQDINMQDRNQLTPLMWAAKGGSVEILEVLVKHGAKLELRNKYDETAFMAAASDIQLESVKFLAEQGADVHARCHHGSNAVTMVSGSRRINSEKRAIDLLSYLIDLGLEIHTKNKFNANALTIADSRKMQLIISFLESKGATR